MPKFLKLFASSPLQIEGKIPALESRQTAKQGIVPDTVRGVGVWRVGGKEDFPGQRSLPGGHQETLV